MIDTSLKNNNIQYALVYIIRYKYDDVSYMTTDLYFLIVRKTKDYHSMEMDRNQTIDKKFPDTICAACYRDDFVCNERRHIVTRGRAVQAWLYDFVRKQPFFLQCK